MKFADVKNIWSVDVSLLSNADRGRVYYERAKQVVREALADPKERGTAIDGKRFRRSYLVEKIGCTASVPIQNPKIKELLADADRRVATHDHGDGADPHAKPNEHANELNMLRAKASMLQRRVDEQAEIIAELRRKLRGKC